MYRAAIDLSNTVVAIGMDEGQSGDYNGVGTWCDFAFTDIPQPEGALLEYVNANDYKGSILKVVDGAVVLRTVEEIQ